MKKKKSHPDQFTFDEFQVKYNLSNTSIECVWNNKKNVLYDRNGWDCGICSLKLKLNNWARISGSCINERMYVCMYIRRCSRKLCQHDLLHLHIQFVHSSNVHCGHYVLWRTKRLFWPNNQSHIINF